ncbi:MAG: hypothetical protein WC455_31220 [Dehalococcoidia bacterium]
MDLVDSESILLWKGVREGLLSIIEVIEKVCKITPRTSEIRDWYKKHN